MLTVAQWSASPACTELEAVMMDWSAKLFGLSPAFLNTSGVGGGVLQVRRLTSPSLRVFSTDAAQTTASDSCLVAVVAARARYMRAHPDAALQQLVLYTTTQTHSLGAKAALVLGLACRALVVHLEDNFALRGNALEAAIKEDLEAGRKPFCLSERFSGFPCAHTLNDALKSAPSARRPLAP
jgi:aromatic-L-amino-acid decarboxylase